MQHVFRIIRTCVCLAITIAAMIFLTAIEPSDSMAQDYPSQTEDEPN